MNRRGLLMTSIGVLVGLIAGYAYYFFVGCTTGTCAITSNPINSTLYGGLMGGLLLNVIFETPKNKTS